jgi:SAM-dependent methyltransferase
MEQRDASAFAWEQGKESARAIVPLVLQYVPAKSVIDVGCGVGTWLSVFSEAGVGNVYGIDNEWVDRKRLAIPSENFFAKDLEKPFRFDKKADLAVCLETAEHLDASAASGLVTGLIELAPAILFSAAIPHQGGVHHVNEQWPQYWADMFIARGYIPVDCIRRKIWDDDRVKFWFKQNIIVYVQKEKLHNYPLLEAEVKAGNGSAHSLVHPYKYNYFAERWEKVVPFIGRLPVSVIHFGKRLLGRS